MGLTRMYFPSMFSLLARMNRKMAEVGGINRSIFMVRLVPTLAG